MARYTGPRNKKARRMGMDLALKTNTKSLDRRLTIPPGVHGRKGRRKVSDYGTQLQEKQKAKVVYGLLEKQFRRYYLMATKNPQATGAFMLTLLERRLDNVVYRLGFAPTRAAARQLVTHGHVKVSDRRVSVPSFRVRVGDVITLSQTAVAIPAVKALLEDKDRKLPKWLERKAIVGKMVADPERDDITEDINEQLIVEYYSR